MKYKPKFQVGDYIVYHDSIRIIKQINVVSYICPQLDNQGCLEPDYHYTHLLIDSLYELLDEQKKAEIL